MRHLQKIFNSESEQETKKFAEKFAKDFLALKSNRRILCLYGDLGAGKTTFIRGLAKGLGIKSLIASPTFTFQRIHRGLETALYHFDCYRFEHVNSNPLIFNEIFEALEKQDGIIVIEWAEKISQALPQEKTEIFMEHAGKNKRRIKIMHNL